MSSITCTVVPEHKRVSHTASLFGAAFTLYVEPSVYVFADRLSPEYTGGYWQFYSLGNGGFFMAPETEKPLHVSCENEFEGPMSGNAFGVTICLYVYSHLSFSDKARLAETCSGHFHLLRDYALEHPESAAIMAAVD